MPHGQYSGSGRLLLLAAALRTVLAQATEGGAKVWEEGNPQVSVDGLWTDADTISLSILPLNLSDHRIHVSVKQENNSSMIMVDTLLAQATATHNTATPLKHKVKELLPDTRYEVCVALSEQGNSDLFPNSTKSECYKVRTFPKVDNVRVSTGSTHGLGRTTSQLLQVPTGSTQAGFRLLYSNGVYTALASVGVFLLACGVTWLIYKAFWSKYFTKVFPVQDSHQEEQSVEGQSVSNSGQEINVEQPAEQKTGPTST